jgi:nucleolar protein 15
VALPQKRKNATIALTADKPKPSASKKDVRPKSKPVKSPLTAANAGRKSDPNPAGKRKKVIPKPVEADSEESEQEWVGFGDVEDEEEDEDEDERGDDSDSSEEELLHGLSSDDQDSSDEEVELPGIDVSKLPTIAKDDKIVKQKLEKAKRQPVRIAFACSSTLLLNFGLCID